MTGLRIFTGFSLDELTNNNNNNNNNNNCILFLMPLIIKENKKDILKQVKHSINSKKGFALKYGIETKNGDMKLIYENCEPVFDEKGNLKYFDGSNSRNFRIKKINEFIILLKFILKYQHIIDI